MRYYIDCLLTDEQREELNEADIDFGEVTIGTAVYHRNGITFDEQADLAKITSVLGIIVDQTAEPQRLQVPGQGAYVADVEVLQTIALPTLGSWVVEAEDGPEEWFRDICRSHQPQLGLGLVLSSMGRRMAKHQGVRGVLGVYALSAPEGAGCTERYDETLSSYRYVCPRNLDPGFFKIIGRSRRIAALFQGDNNGGSLWLLSKLAEYQDEAEEQLDYILTVVERHLNPELGGTPTYQQFYQQSARRRYLRAARQLLEREQETIGNRLSSAENSIREARTRLVAALRLGEAVRLRREVLAGGDPEALLAETVARLEKEFDALMASPDFESIEFEHQTLVAKTRPIKIRYKDVLYNFGRYQIEVGVDRLKIASIDGIRRRRDGTVYCHPHIDVQGHQLCLGNLSESVPAMQASMQFEMLLPLLVRYLETGYNPADCYVRVENFGVPSNPVEEAA